MAAATLAIAPFVHAEYMMWDVWGSEISIASSGFATGVITCDMMSNAKEPSGESQGTVVARVELKGIAGTNRYVRVIATPDDYGRNYIWPRCSDVSHYRTGGFYRPESLSEYYPSGLTVRDLDVGETERVVIEAKADGRVRFMKPIVRQVATNDFVAAEWAVNEQGTIHGTITGKRHGAYRIELTVVVGSY